MISSRSTGPSTRNPGVRIVLTGGPGGGKTTAADLFRREIGDRVVVVPESATTLFAGGFPRVTDADAQRSVQRAIFQVQRSLEDIQAGPDGEPVDGNADLVRAAIGLGAGA